ncbi:type I secretion system permease/ATPase [Candidatus Anaplasma sp. TIGMIC]|uniref:type I secretion system permease/ATPase n=1 Tax=Candidatus Anaplasma sp. TIGMIC TaxID=3020713 RepID=UPI00232D8217|nr:type I secretion system permease/ATPase [Candidatus Anaplasma sp. TIGMIC]MDB1135198.1 type I secretion system permease/ATPase [Candidatus Anaplasma sp. TIGMIC]
MKELKKSVLYQTLEKCKSVFWFVFWFSSAINVLALFLPLYTSQVLDRVLSSGSASTLTMLSIVTMSALLCSALLDVCRSLTMAKVADWIDREATPDLIVRAISLISVKGSASSGEVIRDLGMVKGFITGIGIFSLFDMPWAFVYLIAIFMIHPITGIISVVGIILLVLMAVWNELATKKIMQEASEESVRNIGYIDVASRNAEVVEAMGMIKHIVSEWSTRNDQNRGLQIKAQSRSNAIMGVTKLARSTLQIAVIGVGAWLAIHGQKTAGGIIASSILMGRALAPFEASINTWKMLQSARISYRRLQTLLLTAPKRDQAMSLPTPKGAVVMERVFFTPFGSSKPTIKGVSFAVPPGCSVGIIGASASGKSTLVKLLVGVWKPISGVVRLDGADVYTWNREAFGSYVGYLPQDVELFNASVKTNIARMMPNAEPEKVIKAAIIAGIHDMILQLPNGYDTIIGSGGVVLSGGQKQMVGLARAFYGDVKMLVLDEPNANLDGKAEASLIQALIYAKQQGITTFVVTHKMQLLSVVDQVIVMDDGMMSTMGSRDEIMSRYAASKQAQQGPKPATSPPADAVARNEQPRLPEENKVSDANKTDAGDDPAMSDNRKNKSRAGEAAASGNMSTGNTHSTSKGSVASEAGVQNISGNNTSSKVQASGVQSDVNANATGDEVPGNVHESSGRTAAGTISQTGAAGQEDSNENSSRVIRASGMQAAVNAGETSDSVPRSEHGSSGRTAVRSALQTDASRQVDANEHSSAVVRASDKHDAVNADAYSDGMSGRARRGTSSKLPSKNTENASRTTRSAKASDRTNAEKASAMGDGAGSSSETVSRTSRKGYPKLGAVAGKKVSGDTRASARKSARQRNTNRSNIGGASAKNHSHTGAKSVRRTGNRFSRNKNEGKTETE